MLSRLFFFLVLVAVVVSGFGSSDDRFLKKYAMMKIYESCFGAEVVKEIRREMKAACAKCSSMSNERIPPSLVQPQGMYPGRYPSEMGHIGNRPPMPELGESLQEQVPAHQNEIPMGQMIPVNMQGQVVQDRPNLDLGKLQQAIMAATYYQQQPQGQHVQPVPDIRFGYPQIGNPYGPWMQQPIMQQPNPYIYQQFPSPYFYRNRMSREMDIRSKLEMLTSRASGKVRNVTCVMQELGYLDQNLEPNFEKIAERIENLPVSSELKGDMQEGLQFCQKFSSCVPESKKDNSPLSKELMRPMFFFRCYKHKKLEACVMKDLRDRFTSEDDMDTDTDFRSSRAGKSMKLDENQNTEELDEIAVSIYDFLYGNSDSDLESML